MGTHNLGRKISRLIISYAWVIILLFLALTYVSFPHAVGLMKNISTKLSQLLPDDYPSVAVGEEVRKKFQKKGGGDLIIIIESPNGEINRHVLHDLISFLEGMPEVEKAKYEKPAYDFFDYHKLLYLELDDLKEVRERVNRKIQQEKLGGLYIDFENENGGKEKEDDFKFDDIYDKYRDDYSHGIKSRYYTNSDQTLFEFKIYPTNKDASLKYYKEFYQLIEKRLKDFPLSSYGPNIKLYFAGSIKTRIDEYNALTDDLVQAGIISVSGIFLLLLLFLRAREYGFFVIQIKESSSLLKRIGYLIGFFFHRSTQVILMFLPLGAGIFIGFAICSTFIDKLNVVTSFLFSILFGLGIDIGIHLLCRYAEDRENNLTLEDAVYNVIFRAGRSSSIGIVTTCATFFILMTNDFRGFSEFGEIAGLGLIVILVTYLLLFPSLLVVSEKLGLLRYRQLTPEDGLNDKKQIFPYAKMVSKGCFIVFIISLLLVPFVQFEWNYSELKIKVPETEEARLRHKEITGRVNSAAAIIIKNRHEADILKEEYKRRKESNPNSTIDFYRSIYDLYPEDQNEKMDILKNIDRLLSDDALNVLKDKKKEMVADFREMIHKTRPIQKDKIPDILVDAFKGQGKYSDEQVSFVYPLPTMELGDGRNAIAFSKDAHKVELEGKTFYAVSDAIVFADVLTTMFKDSERAIALSALVLLLLIYLDFRNIRATLYIFGALSFGVIGMGAVAFVIGAKFNFYNMITIPVVLGMGVDSSVHIYHRFIEDGSKNVMGALKTSGMAALMASLTTMLGYSGLAFAHHPGLQSIGSFAVIGMTTCMFGSLVFLPALLQNRLSQKDEGKK